ncbi:MAG: hypothetical protein K6C13_15020 [Oscillospiraceae bacterium]|nr:hypothetical protein [Oscillospiraceae bacterium]
MKKLNNIVCAPDAREMHHCYALQYFVPGCRPAFDEMMQLIIGFKNNV